MSPIEAVVFDFGGVLTASVFGAFRSYGRELGIDPDLPLRVLSTDPEASRLLVDHEEGRLPAADFERGYAERLGAHGVDVPAEGLLAGVQRAMARDERSVALVADLRSRGLKVGLLSNSLGEDCYRGFDLPAMFDAVVISGEIGVRKPSRAAYAAVCEALHVAPERAVMIDDLRQNIVAAQRFGMQGILHRDAATTGRELDQLLTNSIEEK
ncbi:HAD family hydrolase [Calidifontibacter terrae]